MNAPDPEPVVPVADGQVRAIIRNFALVMACLLTISYWRRRQLPFALSWWAFTFPAGAFALASMRLSQVLPLPGIFPVGLAAFTLLTGFWINTLIRSIRGGLDGSVLRPR